MAAAAGDASGGRTGPQPTRTVSIRAARSDDQGAVLALWRADGGAPGATDDAKSLASLRRSDPGALLVADDAGEVVGTLIAAWDGWRGNLYRLVVRADRRRRGVALALVAAGERRLRDLGAVRISALVDADDTGAHAFWSAAGFRPQPERGRWLRHR